MNMPYIESKQPPPLCSCDRNNSIPRNTIYLISPKKNDHLIIKRFIPMYSREEQHLSVAHCSAV